MISAEVRHDFASAPLGHVVPAHPWTWVVTFRGRWELLCETSPDGCVVTSEWVAVDYYTGAWIASQYAYPAGG
ncbi:MAG TPA: hypothetical protein VFO60_04660 [Candidatus Dormibacteraeota bacterium]|nr:hypothetical protein [Candidatus Dormibacteraeota bacterium]